MSDKNDEELRKAIASQIVIETVIDPVQRSREMHEAAARESRQQSFQPSLLDNEELLEVDRSALEAILDVSSRLIGIQRRSRASMSTLAQAHESYRDKQVMKRND